MKIWKLWIGASIALLILSGCSSRQQTTLQNQSIQQARIIEQQKARIDYLNKKIVWLENKQQSQEKMTKNNVKLKKVEDNNFNSDYMYPQAKAKQATRVAQTQTAPTAMGRAECISLVGQEKFDKYTNILGSEGASIKRCIMLKSMTN